MGGEQGVTGWGMGAMHGLAAIAATEAGMAAMEAGMAAAMETVMAVMEDVMAATEGFAIGTLDGSDVASWPSTKLGRVFYGDNCSVPSGSSGSSCCAKSRLE